MDIKDLIPSRMTTERREYLESLESLEDLCMALKDMFEFERNRAGKLIAKKRKIIRELDDLKVKFVMMQEYLVITEDSCDAIRELKEIASE